ncbi:TPA: PD-(D/E)XK nuclease-like domain-containing protein [Escherichia coli]|uniref:RecE family exodeoxyribonuclease n=1 Tax=Escherichia coli TaxID=562 RepID=UPI001B191774|nr:RecE family exodeoxyribonuclease [Escherichia coli]EHS6039249.1 PD-(D/E)XK nuclease-like domain-containing protein [Escherichia coli]EKR1239559.1 PD-(D/E)XK nuclease-like domain-containing protein [Escherichia coli]MCQ1715231.1 PD-(D/E)XK nuclease-like domain-containing protein [Escherichia coli]HBA9006184.1 exonuclease VIII [Escherichia coli]HEI4067459.1 PD-(D/E)XK nuclease-like domain-containing protein [Escherichia coli]
MSTKPLFLLRKAKKSSGQPDAVLWACCDFESACATLDYLIVKSGRQLKNYFKAVATNFPVVDDLPPEGDIDFTWCERYQLGKDNLTWECKPGSGTPSVNDDSINAEIETRNDDASVQPQLTVVATLPLRHRLLAQQLGNGEYLYHVDAEQKAEILRMEMDTENARVQNMMLAAENVEPFKKATEHDIHRVVVAFNAIFPADGKTPELGTIIQFFKAWFGTEHIDRGLLVKEWKKGNRVSGISRTPSGANAGGGILTDRGEGFVHDKSSLVRDVATGVLARSMDIDIYNVHPAHARRIDEIVAENKPPFSVFREAFINMPGGMDYSRAIVVASVKEAPIGIEAIPARVTEYLNRVLTETDHANPDQLIVDIACGRTLAPMPYGGNAEGKSDDEEKPQPTGTVADEQAASETVEPDTAEHHPDPQPLDAQSQVNPVDAEYQKKRAELHEARKNIPPKNPVDVGKQLAAARGEYVDGISDPNDQKWISGHQITSNEVEKSEVQAENYEETPEETTGDSLQEDNEGTQSDAGCDDAGDASDTVTARWPSWFEPGRYEAIPNEVYHSANGISSTMLKDARISLMYYHGRHIARTIPREESDALLRGRIIHGYVLETDKFADEYTVPAPIPEGVVTTSQDLVAIIKEYNAALPALMTPEQMREWIENYNSTLTQPMSLGNSAEETGTLYGSLPESFKRIPAEEKHTASAMKACIKEYNATLTPLLKTSGTREQLLDQIATADPALAENERAKFLPYNVSGTKEQLTEIVREIRPDVVTIEDWQKQQEIANRGKTFITVEMYEQAKNIHAALQNNQDAARLLNHPERKSEISYFGFDEETGLEIRVRPDIEIRLPYESICADLKSVSLGYVRQERLKDRLHREIIERDYHLSAAMYCDVANLDKFFWIFVNKDAGYHWVAVVEASPELLELGRQEYRRTLCQINQALETNHWPAPITESYTDELNDFDLRRLEALSI